MGRHNVLWCYQTDWASMQPSKLTGPASGLRYGSRVINDQYLHTKRRHDGGQIGVERRIYRQMCIRVFTDDHQHRRAGSPGIMDKRCSIGKPGSKV
jgi:hypothetical protein